MSEHIVVFDALQFDALPPLDQPAGPRFTAPVSGLYRIDGGLILLEAGMPVPPDDPPQD